MLQPLSRVLIRTYHTIEVIDPMDILYVKITNGNIDLVLRDKSKVLVDETMSAVEGKLAKYGFITIHRSSIINPHHLVRIIHSGHVELQGNVILPIARRKKKELYDELKEMGINQSL